jgi:hypothetical protein
VPRCSWRAAGIERRSLRHEGREDQGVAMTAQRGSSRKASEIGRRMVTPSRTNYGSLRWDAG